MYETKRFTEFLYSLIRVRKECRIMDQYKNKTLEELLEIRNQLVQAWIIQKSEYQVKQLKKVDYEIEKRKRK